MAWENGQANEVFDGAKTFSKADTYLMYHRCHRDGGVSIEETHILTPVANSVKATTIKHKDCVQIDIRITSARMCDELVQPGSRFAG